MKQSFETARRASIEAPQRMQSRYDTLAIESAWLADSLAESFRSKQEAITRLRQMRLPETPDRCFVGCVVGIGPTEENIESVYFLVPAAGGVDLEVDGLAFPVKTVTLQAPAGKALVGKSVGDEVSIRKGRVEPDVIGLLA